MHRVLERLDRQMTVLVPLVYLAGLFLATAAYFSGLVLDATVAVGVALAFAAEVHSFLEQRRVRLTWSALSKLAEDDAKREQLVTQLRLHVALLAGLVLFSIGNGIAFWASIAHPATTGAWIQIAIRGAVIPVLFLATGALAPVSSDAAALLSQAADDMLYSTVRTSVRQWKRRVRKARKAGVDLAPLAVSLMLDAGESDAARRIQLIADGLARAELGVSGGTLQGRPPTGGGTPLAAGGRILTIPAGWPGALGLPAEQPGEPSQPLTAVPVAIQHGQLGQMGQPAPASSPMSPEEIRVRAVLASHPDLSVDEIVGQTGVAKSTASKVRRIVLAERAVLGTNSVQQMAQ